MLSLRVCVSVCVLSRRTQQIFRGTNTSAVAVTACALTGSTVLVLSQSAGGTRGANLFMGTFYGVCACVCDAIGDPNRVCVCV